MIKYVVKRILFIIPMLIVVMFIINGIMELTPGEPARLILGTNASQEAVDELTIELGYDKPFVVRFVKYVINAFKGDLGTSWQTNRSVFSEVLARFPTTIKLAIFAMVLAVFIGIPLGVLSAVKQYSIFDAVGTAMAMILASVPSFWTALMLIILFSLKLNLLPSFGTGSFAHYILPAVAMSLPEIAVLLRYTRTTMVEAIRQDYIRTARAKGQSERKIVFGDALPNALLPVVTVTGTEFCGMLGGVVTIETVFSINGIGMLIYTSILKKDIPMVTGSAIFLATAVMLMMLAVDILYAYIDPRIKARYLKSVKGNS
ncbi:MAG: ABC transporter permease [Saccharofermentanales bacterium]